MKKVTSKEPITTEAFNHLFAQYVQQVSDQYPLSKSVQNDLKRLIKQVKSQNDNP